MKCLRTYAASALVALVVLQGCTQRNRLPDLRETYGYRDDKPFGGSVAYRMFSASYPGKKPQVVKQQFGENYDWTDDTASVYFNVSRNYFVSERDAESVMDFVYRGNIAFISAENIDTVLLSKLYCKQKNDRLPFINPAKPFRKTTVRYSDALRLHSDTFSYFYYPFNNHFSQTNDLYSRVIGYNETGNVNFFVFFWGKGRVYFHSEPRAFSNYFLLTKNNYRYLDELLQMLPMRPQTIYWDNFHNSKNYNDDSGGSDFSTFDTLMKYPALSHAFFIALFLLVLYILFNSKRRQRVIPVVKQPENTSVAFAEAIAGLYLAKKDNRVIAEKIITYFNEHVRSKYFLSVTAADESYADLLSRKSGVSLSVTERLAAGMRDAGSGKKVSDQQLLTLNHLVEQFFKNKV